jgi:hypothetical protein
MLNTPAKPCRLSIYRFERIARKEQLNAMSALQITGLLLDYESLLTEDCDVVELILDHEYGASHLENRTADWSRSF